MYFVLLSQLLRAAQAGREMRINLLLFLTVQFTARVKYEKRSNFRAARQSTPFHPKSGLGLLHGGLLEPFR